MKTLYIYNLETNLVVAKATGETNEECESKAFAYANDYGASYTPAFGTIDGLIDNDEAEVL